MSSSPASSSVSAKGLTWTDDLGNTYKYFEKPMMKATVFVLIQEMCERLAFYGILPNLQSFLKQFLGYDDSTANSYITSFQSVMYLTPLLAAILADTVLGVYNAIILFSCVYMAGLVLLSAAAIESISQPWMVHLGLMVLIAVGAGGIKSCVNVMGAQQFHPEHHKADITRFFTYFYASINVGGLIGGVVTPILVEEVSFFASFLLPLVAFMFATTVFVIGNFMGRYVKAKPQGSVVLQVIKVLFSALFKCSLDKCRKSKGGDYDDSFIEDAKKIFRLIPIFFLVVPFNIGYAQMTTAWFTQAKKMDRNTFGWDMPAAMMQNVDPVAIIITSFVVDTMLFPALRKRNMMPSVVVRMLIGSLLGCIALLCSLAVEYVVMGNDLFTVSVWWQVPQFWAIAAGEIFLISTSYEVAFTYSPSSLKAVGSAFNLLFFSLASALAGVLFQLCASWMPDFNPEDPTEESHTGAHYDYYYMVLAGVCAFGAVYALAIMPYFNKMDSRVSREKLAEEKNAQFEESM